MQSRAAYVLTNPRISLPLDAIEIRYSDGSSLYKNPSGRWVVNEPGFVEEVELVF